ncbi:hypothetical protein EUBDOL_00443 [Amedibacillus dolichus DSM 3991]|uniref:Uncharacterized protein n=1 Tax=Amedibacillus dolichus DSM 3991 TaxID=428127 RepID=A8R905_9FIRM|nr:hypothetical protein EUBDOL_00443 [Amedibacillus dolichus DSM 3991]
MLLAKYEIFVIKGLKIKKRTMYAEGLNKMKQ